MTLPAGKSVLLLSNHLTHALDDDQCELPFCTKDTINECLSYLNQVFVILSVTHSV